MANREGSYTPAEREKMFLSRQTYEGFKITVNSHIEAIKFLLSIGFSYVLSERFMQDVLEDYFGHQRTLGEDQTIPLHSNLNTVTEPLLLKETLPRQ